PAGPHNREVSPCPPAAAALSMKECSHNRPGSSSAPVVPPIPAYGPLNLPLPPIGQKLQLIPTGFSVFPYCPHVENMDYSIRGFSDILFPLIGYWMKDKLLGLAKKEC